MMRALLVALALVFGCSSSSTRPTPMPEPAATPGEPAATPDPAKTPPGLAPPDQAGCPPVEPGQAMTPEQCTCLGGRMNLSRGGEQEHCARDEQELGSVRFGIEGGWCCQKAAAAP
ncbi:MAG TPA: hypothetical protein VK932_05685 [Kofleriaceae bacterium]|nr:hypothetical protein [Kofleriaceae bacterium]